MEWIIEDIKDKIKKNLEKITKNVQRSKIYGMQKKQF